MAEIANVQLLDEFMDVMKRFRHTTAGCGCGAMHGKRTNGEQKERMALSIEGAHHGPSGGPGHGPHDEPDHGPSGGPDHSRHDGPGHGPDGGPGHGPHGGPGRGPGHGPMMMQMQERILRLIRQKPGISADTLAVEAHVPAHGIQRIVGMLAHKGLADVKKDGDRILTATLTDAGMKRAEQESAAAAKQADELFGVLTEPEKEELSALFLKLTRPADARN